MTQKGKAFCANTLVFCTRKAETIAFIPDLKIGAFCFSQCNEMTTKSIATGVVHKVPADLRKSLVSNSDMLAKWDSLTPIQRNEWICWVTIVKKSETRIEHIKRMVKDLQTGKRNPCCWPGCPHRNPEAKKWFNKNKE